MAIRGFERLRHESCRDAPTESGPQSAPCLDVSGVSRLQSGQCEDFIGTLNVQIARRLAAHFESAEPCVAFAQSEVRLD